MRALSLVMLALVAVPAIADDNSVLAMCRGNDPLLARHFYDTDGGADAVRDIHEVRLTIGQDQNAAAPLYEVRVDALNAAGVPVRAPKTLSRVAINISPVTQNVSLTYAPNRATGQQQVDPFGLLITDGTNGKLRFSQLGDTSRIANVNFDLSCRPQGGPIRETPAAIELDRMHEAEQVATLESLARQLPMRIQYPDDDDNSIPLPNGAYAGALEDVRQYLQTLELTETNFLQRASVYREERSQFRFSALEERCTATRIEWLRPIRDFSGQVLAHKALIACRGVAVTHVIPDHRHPRTTSEEKYSLQLKNVYITSSRLLLRSADFDFQREYDDK